jgi:plasmid stability protein
MTLHLSFPPETEARLRERAAATGKDVEEVVREAVEEKLATPTTQGPEGKSYEQWAAEFKAWVESHKPVGHFVDDSRESIYADRDE